MVMVVLMVTVLEILNGSGIYDGVLLLIRMKSYILFRNEWFMKAGAYTKYL